MLSFSFLRLLLIWQRSFKDCGVRRWEAAYESLQLPSLECMKKLFDWVEAEFLLRIMLREDAFDGFFC